MSVKRHKDVNFDWDQALSFEGRTGPYIQYTHARLCSLLAKWGQPVTADGCDWSALATDEERRLLLHLSRWPCEIVVSARHYEPQIIAAALLDMAQAFNSFYQKVRILDGAETARAPRIGLAACLRHVLAEGLQLLGLKAPEAM